VLVKPENRWPEDRGIAYLPWHIQVLAKYGEGPHNVGLALMPAVLLALWAAARGGRFRQIALAAVLLAAVALSNWVSSLALAIACLLLMLAGVGDKEFRAARVIAAAGLGYLLACFWLTPTFILTIAFNWPFTLRRLKNSFFCAAVVPIFTSDQECRMYS